MDLWTCQFLGVDYNDLKAQVIAGATDEDALNWARENGVTRPDYEKAWFLAYMKTRGFRDDLSKRLAERKKEDPHTDRDDILSFMDYIEIDEGRSL
jgi:cytochrome P450